MQILAPVIDIAVLSFLNQRKEGNDCRNDFLINFHGSYVCVCIELLQPSQPIRLMLSMVSLPNHTFPGQV